MNKPNATPPKAVCAKASPNNANFLRTKNNPTVLQNNAIAIPEISAYCTDWSDKNSKTILYQ